MNDSRTLIRQLIQFLPGDDKKQDYIADFANRQAVWCYALAEDLRKSSSSEKVNEYFAGFNIDSENRPNRLLSLHTEQLPSFTEHYSLDANKQVQLDNTIQRLLMQWANVNASKIPYFHAQTVF